MALITCPECGYDTVSSSAASCPKCGNVQWLVVLRSEECDCYLCNGKGTVLERQDHGDSLPRPCGVCEGKKRVIANLVRDVRRGTEYHANGKPIQ